MEKLSTKVCVLKILINPLEGQFDMLMIMLAFYLLIRDFKIRLFNCQSGLETKFKILDFSKTVFRVFRNFFNNLVEIYYFWICFLFFLVFFFCFFFF
jgi:hypothetical protein